MLCLIQEIVLQFKNQKWERHKQSGQISQKYLSSIWMNQASTIGWAVGFMGEILQFKNRKWERHKQSGLITRTGLNSIWMNQEGTFGWAVGMEGEILQFPLH